MVSEVRICHNLSNMVKLHSDGKNLDLHCSDREDELRFVKNICLMGQLADDNLS